MEAFLIFSVAFIALTVGVVAGVLAVTVLIVKAASAPAWSPAAGAAVVASVATGNAESGTSSSRVQEGSSGPRSPSELLPPTPNAATRQKPRCAFCEAVRAAIRSTGKKFSGR